MSSQNNKLQETIKIISSNHQAAAHFFGNFKGTSIFADLFKNQFFTLENLKTHVKSDNAAAIYWPQITYLEYISSQIDDKSVKDEQVIGILANILRGLKDAPANYYLDRHLFSAFTKIPPHYLNTSDVEIMFNWVNRAPAHSRIDEDLIQTGLGRLIASSDEDSTSISVIKSYLTRSLDTTEREKTTDDPKLTYFSRYGIDNFRKKVFNTKNTQPFLKMVVDVFSEKLIEILGLKELDGTTEYWRPAVESHPQNQFHDAAQSLVLGLLYDASKNLLNAGFAPSQLAQWQNSQLRTFQRLYLALAAEFPLFIAPSDAAKIIIDSGLENLPRHEVFRFLSMQFDQTNEAQKNDLLDQIEKLESLHEEAGPEKNLYNAWKQIRWLQALKLSKDKRANELFAQALNITKGEVEYPDFSSYMSSGWVGPTSPWTTDNFAKASAEEIYKFLKEFTNKDHFREPTTEGLARQFEDYISFDPLKVSEIVDRADDIPFIYVSAMFDGYSKCWEQSKFVPVEKLISLASRISKNEVYAKEFKNLGSKATWTINSISRFIISGTKTDEKAFESNLNDSMQSILANLILSVHPNSAYKNSSDAYTRAINEPRGKLIEALIILALRRKRIAPNDEVAKEKAWTDLKSIIAPIVLKGNSEEVSCYAHLGAYYRQLLYLNADWLYSNLNKIVPKDKKPLWTAFMEGFSYVSVYNKEIYLLLRDRGDLLNFIRLDDHKNNNSSRIDRLQHKNIELSVVAFILKDEQLNDGLLATLLSDRIADEWHHIIWRLPALLGVSPEVEFLTRVSDLILKMVLIRKENPGPEKWIKHFEGADRLLDLFNDPKEEVVKQLLQILGEDLKERWGHDFVIEYLHRFRESHTELVGNYFLDILKNSTSKPVWPSEKIVEICSSLISIGLKSIVAKIYVQYDAAGITQEPTKSIHKLLNN